MRNWLKRIKMVLQDQSGVSTVELVLLLVVMIGLIVIFKDQISGILNSIFEGMEQQIQGVYS